MKKIMMLIVALCLMASMSLFAHDDKKMDKAKEVTATGIVTDPMCAKSGNKEKMENADCAKRCAKDGKLAFVDDKDGKVYEIENGEAVKGHEGHHVKVMGQPNAEKMTFHVTKVSMETGNMDKGDMKHDMKHDDMKKEDKKPEAKKATETNKS